MKLLIFEYEGARLIPPKCHIYVLRWRLNIDCLTSGSERLVPRVDINSSQLYVLPFLQGQSRTQLRPKTVDDMVVAAEADREIVRLRELVREYHRTSRPWTSHMPLTLSFLLKRSALVPASISRRLYASVCRGARRSDRTIPRLRGLDSPESVALDVSR